MLTSGQIFESNQDIATLLRTSAEAAAAQCSGGENGSICGSNWATSKWDGTQGLGQDLSALEIILANMPSKEAQTENGTSTTGATGTTTSDGATATNTNGAASNGIFMVGGTHGIRFRSHVVCLSKPKRRSK